MSAHLLRREALSSVSPRILPLLVLAVLLAATVGPAGAADRVNVMPDRQVRPGVSIPVWGNATDIGSMPGDGFANGDSYTWACSANPDVAQSDDGTLTGTVADDKYISETMSFALLNGSTREQVTCTLTVDDGGVSVDSDDVLIDIVDGLPLPADSISDDELENLAVDVNIAVEDGLRYLYRTQGSSGIFDNTFNVNVNYDCGTTAFAIWAFANSGHTPLNDPDEDVYAEFVEKAVDWILLRAVDDGNPPVGEPIGDPETAITGPGAINDRMIDLCDPSHDWAYSSLVAISGFLSAYGTDPSAVAGAGAFTGETFGQIVQDAMDQLAWGQLDSGTGRGGWHYAPDSGGGDTSTDSWGYGAIEGFESAFGGTVSGAGAGSIKDEAEYRLHASQVNAGTQTDGNFGQFGYGTTAPLGDDGSSTTAAGLSGLVMVTLGGRTAATLEGLTSGTGIESIDAAACSALLNGTVPAGSITDLDRRKCAALGHLAREWSKAGNGSWGGNRGNFYTMWTTARALRLADVAYLHYPNDATGSDYPDADDPVFDWETGEDVNDPVSGGGSLAGAGASTEGYFPYLVRTQDPTNGDANDGSWDSDGYGAYERVLSTAWGVLILQQTVFGSSDPDSDGDGVPDSEDPFPDDPDITGSCASDLCAFADYIAVQDLSRFAGSSDGARARRRAVLKSRAQGACNAMQQCNEPIAIARLDSLIGLTDGLGSDYMVDTPNEITQRATDLKSVIEDGLCVDCP